MGFGGAVSAMITSLKNNSRQKKRAHFDKNSTGGYGDYQKPEYNFPEATPQVLRQVREKMENQKKVFQRKAIIVGILFIILAVSLLIYLG